MRQGDRGLRDQSAGGDFSRSRLHSLAAGIKADGDGGAQYAFAGGIDTHGIGRIIRDEAFYIAGSEDPAVIISRRFGKDPFAVRKGDADVRAVRESLMDCDRFSAAEVQVSAGVAIDHAAAGDKSP